MHPLTIQDQTLTVPIIQGGMGVGISRSGLAGAVAREGGMGVISSAQIGFDQPGFRKDPEGANLEELTRQIRRAKEIAGGRGMIAVNIMAVTRDYANYVATACAAGADAIITGAGLPTTLPQHVEGSRTKIAPIVSTAKAAQTILKYWDKKYGRTADFIVVEGPLAGGHLGFSFETLADLPAYDHEQEIRAIIAVKEQYEAQYDRAIPLFLAGGIMTADDVRAALALGADGVQVATRFVATEECDAAPAYKEAYVQAQPEDVGIVKSPVGMPGRALQNAFIQRMADGKEPIVGCYQCIQGCNPVKAPYCITQALVNAVKGDLDHGLIFCGARVGEIDRITTVHDVIQDLFPEA